MSAHQVWHHMDETERRNWQNPEEILINAGLKAGMTIADIGCGEGFFTLPAARIIGSSGTVYGVDFNSSSLKVIEQKAASENLTNLKLIAGEAEKITVCSGCADMVFFGIVLHDFEDPLKVLKNAFKMLKHGGQLINLDWKKETMTVGPPVTKRFDEEAASGLIKSAGFKIKSVQNSGSLHYLIIAQPD